jgi:hypothetical protein
MERPGRNTPTAGTAFGVLPALILLFLMSAGPSHPLAFPDTAELKRTHRVVKRQDGLPVLFSRILDGDSMSLLLEWKGGRPVSARLEREEGFGDEEFAGLAEAYGAGAAWHEFDDGRKPYEGLVQQWHLQGYGGEGGWLGAGLHRGRHFLIFRSAPPAALSRVEAPLSLQPSLAAFLDTSALWLKADCAGQRWPESSPAEGPGGRPASPGKARKPPPRGQGKPVCYLSNEDSRLRVRVRRKTPPAVDVLLDEGESPALKEVRRIVQVIPDAGQAEYAQDLSQMLLAESQIFLAKLAQKLPPLFTWPSWQLQGSKEGRLPPERYLALVRSEKDPGEFLPALFLDGKGVRLAVNLYYQGSFHLDAEAKP